MLVVATLRSVDQLAGVENPAWPVISEQIEHASVSVNVAPVDKNRAKETLYRLQVTAASALGSIALNCGGMLVDHGWLRLLGDGGEALPSLADANGMTDPTPEITSPPILVVAFDVLGGRFAVNGGGLPAELGEVCYFGPDTHRWALIGGGYGRFVSSALGGGLAGSTSSSAGLAGNRMWWWCRRAEACWPTHSCSRWNVEELGQDGL